MLKISDKRQDSTIKYSDALFDKHSKLNVIRIDLGYKDEYSDDVTLGQVSKEFTHMLNNRRSKPSIFAGNVGYIAKKEYTEDKGAHIHAVFFFDGQKVQKDAFKADEIGAYWKDKITKEKGSFHNCNRNEYDRKGIGMLDHKDTEKRKILNEDVISYLCKEEQDISPIKKTGKEKAFIRRTMPKKRSNKGRPRE